MRALARGPAAVIQPLYPAAPEEESPAPVAVRAPAQESYLPEYDNTPSAFPVALRADPPHEAEEAHTAAPEPPPALDEPAGDPTPISGSAIAPRRPLARGDEDAPRFEPRVLVYALVLAAFAYGVLRILLRI